MKKTFVATTAVAAMMALSAGTAFADSHETG